MTQPMREQDPDPATDAEADREPSLKEYLLGPPYLDIDLDLYIQRSRELPRPFDFDMED